MQLQKPADQHKKKVVIGLGTTVVVLLGLLVGLWQLRFADGEFTAVGCSPFPSFLWSWFWKGCKGMLGRWEVLFSTRARDLARKEGGPGESKLMK